MLNNNKGITLVALTVTIIILIILASVATYSGVGTVKYIKFKNAKAQFETMQEKAIEWYEQSKESGAKRTAILDYGVENNDASCNQTKKATTFEDVGINDSDEQARFKYFNSSYIKDTLGIEGISHDFLIDVQNYKVLLFGGIKYEGETYYTANQFNIKIINYSNINGTITFDKTVDNKDIIIYNIQGIPNGIKKYNVQYKLSTDNTWMNLTKDNKKSYTDSESGITYNDAWYIKNAKVGNYNIRIITPNNNVSSAEQTIEVEDEQI